MSRTRARAPSDDQGSGTLPRGNAFTSTDACCTARMPMRTSARAKRCSAAPKTVAESRPSCRGAPQADATGLDAARGRGPGVYNRTAAEERRRKTLRASDTRGRPLFRRSRSTPSDTCPRAAASRPSATSGPRAARMCRDPA